MIDTSNDRSGEPDDASLAAIIINQSAEAFGIPVLLFTNATLSDRSRSTSGDDHDPQATGALDGLGIDPDHVELFGTEAYVVQSALGARLMQVGP